MKNILFINACVRDNSRTKILTDYYLSKIDCNIDEVDLSELNILPLDKIRLKKREELISKGEFNSEVFSLANAFASADEIVIAAPFWDMSFPSGLKMYIENICVLGITFEYKNNLPVGLCRAEKLVYISTCGGSYFKDFGENYIKFLSQNLFGIKEFVSFSAENLDIVGADIDGIMNNAKSEIDKYFK